jgi:hypothetical protein
LPCGEREASAAQELSGGCERGPRRVHCGGVKHAVRLGCGEMTLHVEGVCKRRRAERNFLGRTRALEPLHLALPPPGRLRWILSSIVLPSPALAPTFKSKIARRRAVRSQVLRDQSLRRKGVFLEKFAHQFQRSIPLDEDIEDLAFGVDCAPEIDHPATDFQIDLVQMPDQMRLRARLRKSAAIIGPK